MRRYLAYIVESIQLIERWNAAGPRDFLTDDLIQNATLHRLETLADSTGRLPARLKEQYPEIPWRQITDFRNRVSHGYLDVDLDLVWRVIEVDLPALRRIAESELNRDQRE